MAFGSYEVGVIQRTPVPDLDTPDGEKLGTLALACVNLKRGLDTATETSHVFQLPALLQASGDTLAARGAAWAQRVAGVEQQLAAHQHEIDDIAFTLYGIAGDDRAAIEAGAGGHASEDDASEDDTDDEDEAAAASQQIPDLAADLLSYLMGGPFGRWDVRYATGAACFADLPDPFAPLPVCSPAMLTGSDGLPLTATPPDYPLPIAWDGILVDDPDHENDIVRRVGQVLELVWGERAEAIAQEACAALEVAELRDYFRRPGKGGFWDDHIKRYSKSRRKAPIYWLLQSAKKNYALWLYYHRLDSDILYKALLNYVEPKIRLEEHAMQQLVGQRAVKQGRELKELERQVERQEAFISELRDFETRLRRVADLHLAPDLNDGVVLNIAPLWDVVPWKEAKKYWDELLKGKYEWSSIGTQLRAKGMVK
jgi:hypothetical protein